MAEGASRTCEDKCRGGGSDETEVLQKHMTGTLASAGVSSLLCKLSKQAGFVFIKYEACLAVGSGCRSGTVWVVGCDRASPCLALSLYKIRIC